MVVVMVVVFGQLHYCQSISCQRDFLQKVHFLQAVTVFVLVGNGISTNTALSFSPTNYLLVSGIIFLQATNIIQRQISVSFVKKILLHVC